MAADQNNIGPYYPLLERPGNNDSLQKMNTNKQMNHDYHPKLGHVSDHLRSS